MGFDRVLKASAEDSDGEISGVYEVQDGQYVAVPKDQWDEYTEVKDWEDFSDDQESKVIKPVISPNRRACMAGWGYSASKKGYKFYKIVGGTHYLNKTKNNIKYTSSFSGSHSKSSTASGKLGGGWGPISAEVGYSAHRKVTWTKSESVTLTIRPKYEGWNDYGTKRDHWYGTYEHVNSDCM